MITALILALAAVVAPVKDEASAIQDGKIACSDFDAALKWSASALGDTWNVSAATSDGEVFERVRIDAKDGQPTAGCAIIVP